MPAITRAQARQNETTLLRLAAGPTRREEGSRRLRHAATDAAVYAALVSHQHWRTGRCLPGYRAIARLARVALGTVSAAVHRLQRAGFIRLRRFPVRVSGHGLRWAHAYTLMPDPAPERVPERPRSVFGAEPGKGRISLFPAPIRSVEQQLAELRRWIAREKSGPDAVAGAQP